MRTRVFRRLKQGGWVVGSAGRGVPGYQAFAGGCSKVGGAAKLGYYLDTLIHGVIHRWDERKWVLILSHTYHFTKHANAQ